MGELVQRVASLYFESDRMLSRLCGWVVFARLDRLLWSWIWVGLVWVGLDSVGFAWVWWDWLGLVCVGLDWLGVAWVGLDWLGVAWSGWKKLVES